MLSVLVLQSLPVSDEGFVDALVDGIVESLVEGIVEGLAEGTVEGIVEGLADGNVEGLAETLPCLESAFKASLCVCSVLLEAVSTADSPTPPAGIPLWFRNGFVSRGCVRV